MLGKKPSPFVSHPVEERHTTQSPQKVFAGRQKLQQASLGNGFHGAVLCTACGNHSPVDALFCDQCGLEIRGRETISLPNQNISTWVSSPGSSSTRNDLLPSSCEGIASACITSDGLISNQMSLAEEVAKPLSWNTQRWIAPGAALASILVITLGVIIRHASAPQPTEKEVMEALGRDSIKISAPSQDLLCLSNLPYHRHHVQIPLNDQISRVWLDSLVQVGLYTSPVEVIPEGMSSEASTTLLKYQTLPAINSWRRNGRLCVAERWVIDSVLPGSIRKDSLKPSGRYLASIIWRADGIAPWLDRLPDARTRLAGVGVKDGKLIVTMQQELY